MSRNGLVGVAMLTLVWLAALPALADAERIQIDVMVSHISDQPGEIDARAKRLDEKLRAEFRYGSLRVLERRTLKLAIDDVGSVDLPNGRVLRVRPLHVGDSGVLVAVSVEGLLETDMRMRSGHLVVIGTERYRDGKLVVSLEPRF